MRGTTFLPHTPSVARQIAAYCVLVTHTCLLWRASLERLSRPPLVFIFHVFCLEMNCLGFLVGGWPSAASFMLIVFQKKQFSSNKWSRPTFIAPRRSSFALVGTLIADVST
ncbi:hypothetical protein BC940DRAFT_304270 [Gongronella butleri]|nr:hypothetical protein BC940DRAFT_304270 [Gongronella butleri]